MRYGEVLSKAMSYARLVISLICGLGKVSVILYLGTILMGCKWKFGIIFMQVFIVTRTGDCLPVSGDRRDAAFSYTTHLQTDPTLPTCTVIIGLVLSLVSQIRIVLSTLHDANTVSSVGLHCRSSTLPSWPLKAPPTCHRPPSCSKMSGDIEKPAAVVLLSLAAGDRTFNSRG